MDFHIAAQFPCGSPSNKLDLVKYYILTCTLAIKTVLPAWVCNAIFLFWQTAAAATTTDANELKVMT